jgi:chemotaxis methyl-accepting protein methylase
MEHEWTFSSPFDYIHGRMLFTCFTVESAKAIFTSAFHALNPGGYLSYKIAFSLRNASTAPRSEPLCLFGILYAWKLQ